MVTGGAIAEMDTMKQKCEAETDQDTQMSEQQNLSGWMVHWKYQTWDNTDKNNFYKMNTVNLKKLQTKNYKSCGIFMRQGFKWAQNFKQKIRGTGNDRSFQDILLKEILQDVSARQVCNAEVYKGIVKKKIT